MTVGELRKSLEHIDDSYIVVMSKDGEGNAFSPLAQLEDRYIYVPDSTWSGSIYLEALDELDREAGYTDEDLYHGDDGQGAIVLWPTN